MNRSASTLAGAIVTFLGALLIATLAPERAPAHQEPIPVYGYKIVNTYPHDPKAFTQGLIYDNGFLYESTGYYGQSSLRKVELNTGKVLQIQPLSAEYFGEGLTLWQDKLIQLTWLERSGFVYDKESFQLLKSFTYPTGIREGWGLTHDATRLIMSDGTSGLSFLNPETFERTGRITVRDNGTAVDRLNELEYIKGEIYANVWYKNVILRISPETGQVVGRIDLTGLLSEEEGQKADVLNGIAYDAEHDRLLVTGKLWPKLFHIEPILKKQ
jgi:glutaminyl-peptide cyclotransferase